VRKSHEKRLAIKVGKLASVTLLLSLASAAIQPVLTAEDRKNGCAGPEYRQFDFWLGDWDVFDLGNTGPAVAHTRVDQILGGCALHEDYQGTDGHSGESFTIYDHVRKVWHQTWVTNGGVLVVIEGRIQGSAMVLKGNDYTAGELVRGRWEPENGNVRETAVTSTDGGKTWKPWFDLLFRAHKL
jgi:hypothetical protein